MKTHKRSFPALFQVDDYIEFHAARILLLLQNCNGIIDGRTKLAKLDFFLRYPAAINRVIDLRLLNTPEIDLKQLRVIPNSIESQMIRYRYGPWDPKYPIIIPFLQSLDLIQIHSGRAETYTITERGKQAVVELLKHPSYEELDLRSKAVNQIFGDWAGSQIKKFIYDNFDEIAKLPIGEPIQSFGG
jgi:DNA-binding PadR family transcriptional regulator